MVWGFFRGLGFARGFLGLSVLFQGSGSGVQSFRELSVPLAFFDSATWEFPKIGDPNIVP